MAIPSRVRSLTASAIAFTATAVLLVGIPVALVRLVGNPLPTALPDWEQFQWSVTNGQIPDRFWIGLLACTVWLAWTQLVVAFLIETVAAMRGIQAPSLPGFGLAQGLAYSLVAKMTLTTSLLLSSPGSDSRHAPYASSRHASTSTQHCSAFHQPRTNRQSLSPTTTPLTDRQ